MNNFYSGTSGLVTPVPRSLYPVEFQGKGRLEYYASFYNSIEINSSFYKLPLKTTIKKWAEAVPENFRFTFKLSKSVTHVKGLEFDKDDVDKFMDIISQNKNKRGCILIQFPPGLFAHIRKLEELLNIIRYHDPLAEWKIAIEFRHNTWYHEKVYRLLEKFNVTLVQHDIPGKSPPPHEYESGVVYLRFHGPGGKYRGSYDDYFLYEYAGYINDWINDGKIVYAYFNNTMGDALKNLNSLNSFVIAKK